MIDINSITTSEFKALFGRDFPYLPEWQYGKAYFTDEIAYVAPNFYISLIDENEIEPSNDGENWKLYNDNIENYISDTDIQKAFLEAKINFNPRLFSTCEEIKTAFCYLAAHYLVIDLNNANNPFALGGMGIVQSKTVGSVSESYGLPRWVLNDKNLGLFAQTGYGLKYLSLILPRLSGNIIFTPGAISFR